MGSAVPESPQATTISTVLDIWKARLRQSPEMPAFRFRNDGRWDELSYSAVDERARALAAALVGAGLLAGDRVAILSQTRLEWMLADLAVAMSGCVSVPIYPSSTADQCAYILRDSGARWAFVEDALALEKLLPYAASTGLSLVVLGGDTQLEKPDARGRTTVRLAEVTAPFPAVKVFHWEALVEQGRRGLAEARTEAVLRERGTELGPESTFTIIYTSGTTGEPKGVVLSHGNVALNVVSASRALTITASDVQLLFLPLAHVLAREVTWAPIWMGGVTAFAESLAKLRDNLLEVRPTFMVGVPRVFEKFYTGVQAGARTGSPLKRKLVAWGLRVGADRARAARSGDEPAAPGLTTRLADKLVLAKLRGKLGLDRCRFLISGGAPLAPEIAEFFHGTGLLILEGYGLTETVGAAFVNRLDRYRFGTVGPALDVVECRIADDGEILVRGPTVFKRYFNNAAATTDAIDADGWFHTGDIGHLEDGFLRITDRKKDLIVLAGGKKVAPQMLENALKARTRLIAQALVYGDKRPYCVALLTLNDEGLTKSGGDAAQADKHPELLAALAAEVAAVNAQVASFETIKRWVVLPADFTEAAGELTPSLKIKRKVVVEKYRALIDGLYAGTAGHDAAAPASGHHAAE